MKDLFYLFGRIFAKPFLYVKIRYEHLGNIFSSGVFSKSLKNSPKNLFVERSYSLKGGEYIMIGDNFIGNRGLIIEALTNFGTDKYSPSITIGNNVFMNQNCRIQCINRIEIGDGVMFAGNIFITDHFHGDPSIYDENAPAKRQLFSKGPVKIGDFVWIGEGVVIMPNVRIGKHAIIGSNAVVTKDVEDFTIVGGIPAKVLRKWKE